MDLCWSSHTPLPDLPGPPQLLKGSPLPAAQLRLGALTLSGSQRQVTDWAGTPWSQAAAAAKSSGHWPLATVIATVIATLPPPPSSCRALLTAVGTVSLFLLAFIVFQVKNNGGLRKHIGKWRIVFLKKTNIPNPIIQRKPLVSRLTGCLLFKWLGFRWTVLFSVSRKLFLSRMLEAKTWMWAAREVEGMEVNLHWLVQFKLQTSMARTGQADTESTDGVRGLSWSAGAPLEA